MRVLACDQLGFIYTIALADGLPGWYRSLERASLIEDSELDPFDDRLIAAWQSMADLGAIEG